MRFLILLKLALLAASACSSSADGAIVFSFGLSADSPLAAHAANRSAMRQERSMAKAQHQHAQKLGVYAARPGATVYSTPRMAGVYVPAPAAYTVRRTYAPPPRSYYSRNYFYGY